MSSLHHQLGLEEAAKRFSRGFLKLPERKENRLGSERLFRTLEGLMPVQLAVHNCPSKRIAICGTRRSGKSYLAAPWFVELGMTATKYNQTDFFVAPTLDQAEGLVMRHIEELRRNTGLDFKIRAKPLSVEFPSGARLILRGAKDLDDLGALVGYPTAMVWVDECQDIRDDVLRFIQNKVGPALRDLRGRLIYSGTPGPVRAGLWFELATGMHPNWANFGWSLFDNPNLPPEARDLELILQEEGYTVDTPAFKREYLGLWVEDDSALVYRYNMQRNGHHEFTSKLPEGHVWHHVIGVDFGFNPDPSAVSVFAYSNTHPTAFFVGEWKSKNKDYSQLWHEGVRPFWERFGPCRVVGDAASPQAIAELNNRWGIGMEPCVKGNKKTSKPQWIELMNADFNTGKIMVPPESVYARELVQLVWDPKKWPAREEHPRRDNHLCDASLYAWIEAKNWYQKEASPSVHRPMGDEAFLEQIRKHRQSLGSNADKTWADDSHWRS